MKRGTKSYTIVVKLLLTGALFLSACSLSDLPGQFERFQTQIYFDQAVSRAEPAYSEDFSGDAADWYQGPTRGGGSTGIVNASYRVESPAYENSSFNLLPGQPDDVIVTATIRGQETAGLGTVGIYCRYVDAENFYVFVFAPENQFGIFRSTDAEYVALVDWSLSEDIDWRKNDLQVTALCLEDRLILAVDGNVRAEVRDSSFTNGDVGLGANAWDDSGFTVAVDSFTIGGFPSD
jgi:hypothetical protein